MSKKSRPKKKQHKERGVGVTIFLVLMAIHGLFATYFYYALRTQQSSLERPVILGLMLLHSFANVIAALGIWYWKKWAIYLYAGSTILAVVVGLISVGAWSLCYMVLPFIILGWLLQTKWNYFE